METAINTSTGRLGGCTNPKAANVRVRECPMVKAVKIRRTCSVAQTFGNTDGENLAPMANASTAEWSSDRSTSLSTSQQCFVPPETSTWLTSGAKESPLLSHSWPITMASANLHPAIVGRLTPPKWGTVATCGSGSFRDGADTP